jgi:hypothetical protein
MMTKSFLRYLSLFLVTLALLSAVVVARGWVSFPAQAGPSFDAKIDMNQRDEISAEEPQIILLGDSMVEENVDLPALSEALGRTIHRISYPGAASAMWYLSIKNNIILSPHKPQALIILFRDSTLTTPNYRVGGSFNEAIDKLAGADEKLFIQLAYLNQMNPLERSARQFFPWYVFGFKFRDRVDFVNRYALPRVLLGCRRYCVDMAFLNIFSFRTMAAPAANDPIAQSESILYTENALNFPAQVGDSFLPEIIRLCRENGIPLILVRGKTISFVQLPKPSGLDEYILELKEYLTKNGVRFADLEGDSRLGVEDYIDRFHVQPEARGAYTQMLAEALVPLLP